MNVLGIALLVASGLVFVSGTYAYKTKRHVANFKVRLETREDRYRTYLHALSEYMSSKTPANRREWFEDLPPELQGQVQGIHRREGISRRTDNDDAIHAEVLRCVQQAHLKYTGWLESLNEVEHMLDSSGL